MRKSVSLLVLNLLLGSAACELSTGEEDEGGDDGGAQGAGNPGVGDRGTRVGPDGGSSGPGNDAAAPATPDASISANDAGSATSDAAVTAPAMTGTSATPEQCKAVLASASTTCGGPDAFEPNDDKASAIAIDTSTGCGFVAGKLSSNRDRDFYSFSAPRTDPVAVQLGYESTPSNGSDLRMDVLDAMGSTVYWAGGDRDALTWFLDGRFVSKKGVAYSVQIHDTANGGCQGYNLRVNTNFCTDEFEDNDTKSAATKGLEYGKTLTATVFGQDDDFYDLSAIQTGGAKCTLTTDLELSSTERLRVEASTGTNSTVFWQDLSGADGTNVYNFTLRAASGASALMIRSDTKTCTHYTLVCNQL